MTATEGNPLVVKICVYGPGESYPWCENDTHIFDEPRGRCRCGLSEWDAPPKLRLVE